MLNSSKILHDLGYAAVIETVTVIIFGILYFLRKRLTNVLSKRWYYELEIRNNIKDFKKEFRSRRHPAVAILMLVIARTSAANLFKRDGEELKLDEYGDILISSLNRNLKECVFIARTKPSDWYASGDIGTRIRGYFKKQCELKKDLKDKIRIVRYIILPNNIWNKDNKREQLIREHNIADIELFYCDKDTLPGDFSCHDRAVFEDKQGKKWAIESLNFDENTIGKYLKNSLPIRIKVMIEDDQNVLNSCYKKIFEVLNSHSNLVTTASYH